MPTVWLLMFMNVNNQVSSPVAIFATKDACLTTAKTEWRAANPQGDKGLHYTCEDFSISTEAGLECEPHISKNCLMKQGMKEVWTPNLGHK